MAWARVDFLETGDSYYKAVLASIGEARHSVLVEKYIFRNDQTGKQILSAMASARQKGARVYLRVDGVGSRDEAPALSDFCRSKNIEFEVFHPLPFAAFASFFRSLKLINRRTHRKLVIVDGLVAFSGGRNVDDVESERCSGSQAWHDLSVKLEGPSVAKLVQAFWMRTFRRHPSHDFLLNYTWRLKLARNTWFVRKLQRSRKRFWVVTPYFAPTPAMLFQIFLATKRGVDVRLILPQKIDVELSRMAARAAYDRLLRWGVRIYEFQAKVLHRKLWLIDDTALVGSGNLNHRSFMHDLELDVILRESSDVKRAEELFLADQVMSRRMELRDMERLPAWKRAFYWLASWLVYWL
ncbi:MAG TPA: phosphatidylserine/phosphatidylglycerophosphate/cardiolipin synthase family protein [Bdellovibrionota bacterium]|jgi:cardiolipin synthase